MSRLQLVIGYLAFVALCFFAGVLLSLSMGGA
jgi:hypothetical protein